MASATVAFRRLPLVWFLLSIIPSLIPIAAADLLLTADEGFTGSFERPPLLLAVPAALAVAAVAGQIATHATREITVDP